jgi:hypothetical protein
VFLIVLVPKYKLSLCHIPMNPDLLGFSRISVFTCGLLDYRFKRFESPSLTQLFSLYNRG